MTNYERICKDKAFCAFAVIDDTCIATFEQALEWLDTEQVEVSGEREHKEGV